MERIQAERRRLAEAGPRVAGSAGDFERVALPNADANVLRDLLVAERATVVIEVGLAYGASALAIAEALVSRSVAETEPPGAPATRPDRPQVVVSRRDRFSGEDDVLFKPV